MPLCWHGTITALSRGSHSHTCVTRRRLQCLQESIVQLGAKLVVVDSVASLVRKEYDSDSSLDRNDFLAREASILKYDDGCCS